MPSEGQKTQARIHGKHADITGQPESLPNHRAGRLQDPGAHEETFAPGRTLPSLHSWWDEALTALCSGFSFQEYL